MEPDINKISPDRKKIYEQSKLIVIKVGSSLLVEDKLGAIKKEWFASFIDDVIDLRKKGKTVIIVSSGAINLGRKILNLKDNELTLEQEQAAASVGQIELSKEYQEHFKLKGLICSQVLITLDDFTNRRRYLNCKSTFKTLLKFGVIPIVNENDTVATDEIRYGDNDRLAARVAQMSSSDLLILLSDIDGLYDKNPHLSEKANHIPKVKEINDDILKMAGSSHYKFSSGGMITKLEAAKISSLSGCKMIICNGEEKHAILELAKKRKYTIFEVKDTPLSARKKWIAAGLNFSGRVTVDEGASKALKNGSSLLPAGVIKVDGSFEKGDLIEIFSHNGIKIASGLTSYNSQEIVIIAGKKTYDIETLLGYVGRDELIHRDDLVLGK